MRTLILASIAALAIGGMAQAQTMTTSAAPKAATTSSAKTPKAKTSAAMSSSAPSTMSSNTSSTKSSSGRKPMTAESKACSAQADTKNLHGKDRQKFRRACMKGK